MKKLLLLLSLVSTLAVASPEKIFIQYNATPAQPNTGPYLKMLEIANKSQNKYDFILEYRSGAQGVLALKAMDTSPQNRLATIATPFVENARTGQINESDYAPVTAQGDACWAVVTNVGDTKKGLESLRGQKEITVGGTGFGNAAHITAIMLSEKYGFKIRYIVYKSNYDALVNMAAGEPINFVLESVKNYQEFKRKNPNLQILGINCKKRNPYVPEIKTVHEQGFNTPAVFLATVANVKMPVEKREEIGKILTDAQTSIGADELYKTADLVPPQFQNPPQTVQEFFNSRVLLLKVLTHRYSNKINEAR